MTSEDGIVTPRAKLCSQVAAVLVLLSAIVVGAIGIGLTTPIPVPIAVLAYALTIGVMLWFTVVMAMVAFIVSRQ